MTGGAHHKDPADEAFEALLETLQQHDSSSRLSDEQFEYLLKQFKALGSVPSAAVTESGPTSSTPDSRITAEPGSVMEQAQQHYSSIGPVSNSIAARLREFAASLIVESQHILNQETGADSLQYSQSIDNISRLNNNLQILAHKDSADYVMLLMLEKQVFALPVTYIAEVLGGNFTIQCHNEMWMLQHDNRSSPLLDVVKIMHNKQAMNYRQVYLLLNNNDAESLALGVDSILGFERIKTQPISLFASEQAIVSGIFETQVGLNVLLMNIDALSAHAGKP